MFAIVMTLASFYLVYFFLYFRFPWDIISIKTILIVVSIIHVLFLSVPFISSNDLHSYVFGTRIFVRFGENPYLKPYEAFPQDEFYGKINTIWSSQTILYGPLFLLIGGVINNLGMNNVSLTVFLFKLLLVGVNIINALLIYKITKSTKASFLYGLNPIVIFELAGNTHTESLLIFFLLCSFLFIKKRPITGAVNLIASFLIKYSTVIFVPLVFLYVLKKSSWKIFLISLLFGVLITIVVYMPFWQPHIFDYLTAYYNGQYTSPALGIAVGQQLLGSYRTSFQINTILFLLFSGLIFMKFLFSKASFKKLIFYCFLLYFVYLITKLSLVLVWYTTPLLALASICACWKKYKNYALASIVFVSIYSLGLYIVVR